MKLTVVTDEHGTRLKFRNDLDKDQWLWEPYTLTSANHNLAAAIDTQAVNGTPVTKNIPSGQPSSGQFVKVAAGKEIFSLPIGPDGGRFQGRYAALHPLNGQGAPWELLEATIHVMTYSQM